MALRLFRRIRIAPGVTLNLTKQGGSLSFGPRGAKLTADTSGVRRTIGLPGTGLWYTEHVGKRSTRRPGRAFDRLPAKERPFILKSAVQESLNR